MTKDIEVVNGKKIDINLVILHSWSCFDQLTFFRMGPLACRIEEFVALITLWGFHCKIFFGSFTCQLLYVMYSCDLCSPCNTRSLFLSKSYKTFVQFGVLLGEKYNWKINLFGVMPLWMTNIVQCWMHYIFFFILDFVISKVEGHWSAPMLLTLWQI